MIEKLVSENKEIRAKYEEIRAELDQMRQLISGLKNVSGSIEITPVGNSISLENSPNPFSSVTTIKYSLPANASEASLVITNMNGQKIKTFQNLSENGQLNFNSENLRTGVYNCTLIIDGQLVASKKMILNR